jgi:hypothetical protein
LEFDNKVKPEKIEFAKIDAVTAIRKILKRLVLVRP